MAEPLTTAEAKAHLRVTDTSEDSLIASYIVAAREWVENYTGHVLVERELTASFTEFGDFLTIHSAPNVVIDSIAYLDADGNVADFAYFAYPAGINPVKIYPLDNWPTIDDNSAILVTYTAGYASASDVPQALKQAMLLLIAAWHQQRGTNADAPVQEVPFAVTALCRAYRGAVLA